MRTQEQSIEQEMRVHGRRWETILGGYFSDPEVARPLVEAILQAIDLSPPAVVADLDGGTGFILRELLRKRPMPGVRLVNVDISPAAGMPGRPDNPIAGLCGSGHPPGSSGWRRRPPADCQGDPPLLSQPAQWQLLSHLRSVQRDGELLVHHSSCLQDAKDAECLSLLYDRMGTQK